MYKKWMNIWKQTSIEWANNMNARKVTTRETKQAWEVRGTSNEKLQICFPPVHAQPNDYEHTEHTDFCQEKRQNYGKTASGQ